MEHSIAAKYAARPAARFVRPSAGPASAGWASAVAARSTRRHPAAPTVLRAPDGRVAGPPARRLARDPRRPVRRTPSGRPRPAGRDALGPLRARRHGRRPGAAIGAVARLRTSTATSAGGIVVRYEAGTAPTRRRQPPARARRRGRGRCPRAPRTRGETPSRPHSARSPRRPGSRSGSPARSSRSNTGSSSPGRGSTRRSTTS